MTNVWQRVVDIKDLRDQLYNGTISVVNFCRMVALRLQSLVEFGIDTIDTELKCLISAFAGVERTSDIVTIDDVEELLCWLCDWGDTQIEDVGRVCWIKQ